MRVFVAAVFATRTQMVRHRAVAALAHFLQRGINGVVGGVAFGATGHINSRMCQRDTHFRHTQYFRGAESRLRNHQGGGLRQAHVFAGANKNTAGNKARVLAAFQHTRQPIHGGVRVGAAHGFDKGGNNIVMFVAFFIII